MGKFEFADRLNDRDGRIVGGSALSGQPTEFDTLKGRIWA